MPERLSALDASFLYLEGPAMHMHVAGLSILDPSTRPDGRLPFEDVEAVIASRIHIAPRFRQRILTVPGNLGRPVWVDDHRFDLGYHLRRLGLPEPGGRRELAEVVQQVLSRPLDRGRPLWDVYFIDGLQDGLVALLMKAHHALVDGIAAMHLASAIFDLAPGVPEPGPPEPWTPEPVPSPGELVLDALVEQVLHPVEALVRAAETVMEAPSRAAASLSATMSGVRDILGMGQRPRSSLDVRIGPNRRFAMADAPVERFKAVKNALGGTVNDVILTAVAAGLHELLRARGETTRGRTLRALVPVSVRTEEQRGLIGNRIAPAFVDIPVGPMSPRTRLARVRAGTAHLKESMMAMSADAIINLGTYAPPALHSMAARLLSRGEWFNVVISNVPAPQVPLYLAGAKLLASYPSLPLGENSALSVAVTSLAGTMAFGLTGDYDAMPDVDLLAAGIEHAIADLCKAAGV